eukprot:1404820-Pleurochrysis_carterae.AAC.3
MLCCCSTWRCCTRCCCRCASTASAPAPRRCAPFWRSRLSRASRRSSARSSSRRRARAHQVKRTLVHALLAGLRQSGGRAGTARFTRSPLLQVALALCTHRELVHASEKPRAACFHRLFKESVNSFLLLASALTLPSPSESAVWCIPSGRSPVEPVQMAVPDAHILQVCRAAVQLLVHVGSLDASLLRRVLGGADLKAQVLHVSHLVLQLRDSLGHAALRGALLGSDGAAAAAAEGGGASGSGEWGDGGGNGGDGGGAGAGNGVRQSLALSALAASPTAADSAADARLKASEVRGLLHEVLLLLGIFTLGCPKNSEMLRWRWGSHPTMLHRLCRLPFNYFCEPKLRVVLLPTLLCGCFEDATNLRILSSELSLLHLSRFLSEQMRATAEAAPTSAALPMPDPSELPVVSMDYALSSRIPPALWPAALAFFSQEPEHAEHSRDSTPQQQRARATGAS